MKALARLVGAVSGHDHSIELQNLLLDAEQLIAERGKTRTGDLWHSLVVWIGDDIEQFLDTVTPTGATIPNSARWARIALITEVC